jgi:hypothetical protein
MMPDSDASRLARLEQRVEDHDVLIRTVGPIATQAAVQTAEMSHMRDEVRDLETLVNDHHRDVLTRFSGLEEGQRRRDEERKAEDERRAEVEATGRRQLRMALYGLIGVLGAAFIGALATILATILA